MSLVEQLSEDMNGALKAGEADRLSTLRLLRSSMSNERIKLGHELNDAEALKVLQREAKQRRDSIEQYESANRKDLADKESSELRLIETYLPQPLSEEELTKLIDETISSSGITPQMGVVIGSVMVKVGARADGGTVSRLVRARLNL